MGANYQRKLEHKRKAKEKKILKSMPNFKNKIVTDEDEPICELCDGTGRIVGEVWNAFAHCYENSGSVPCQCQDRD